MVVLSLRSVSLSMAGQCICRDLDLQLESGQSLGVLGRNGVGKTTLLHSIMGFHQPDAGQILLRGVDVATLPRRQLAREAGLLFQETPAGLPATVLETVMLGRHPYAENLLWDSARDLALAEEALAMLDLTRFRNRQVGSLSGGEKQRLAVAALISQEPALMLLDEPSNHLDIDYQLRILALLTTRTRQQQRGLVMASHDINLVARYCDRVLLLLGDGRYLEGPTRQLLTTTVLEQAFHVSMQSFDIGPRRYFLPG